MSLRNAGGGLGGAAGGGLGGAVSPVSFCIQNSSGWVQKLMMCQQFS